MQHGSSIDSSWNSAFSLRKVVLSLLLLLVVAPTRSQSLPGEPVATIPFVLDNHGFPAFQATIAGKNANLYIDTGGYKALALIPDSARRLSVRYDPESSSRDANNYQGRNYVSHTFSASLFEAGSLRLPEIRGGDLSQFSLPNSNLDGYIGIELLKNYLMVFDYKKGELRLYAPSDASDLSRECGGSSFAIELQNDSIIATGITEFGPRRFLLDTGSSRNVFRPSSLPVALLRGQITVELSNTKFGSYELNPATFLLVPFQAPDVDGVLGREFFDGRKVCIDLVNKVVSVD